ncbi:MAG TPA: hypothetical protein VIJ28_19775 [Chloroflexota bacterium]|jgi:hypothetical protein
MVSSPLLLDRMSSFAFHGLYALCSIPREMIVRFQASNPHDVAQRLWAADSIMKAPPYSAALLVGLFIMGFSVLQTQYLLWLLPLAALVLADAMRRARLDGTSANVPLRAAAFLLLFAALSHLLRMEWAGLLAMQPAAVAIAIIRNSCLVLALVSLWRCRPRVRCELGDHA